MGGLERAHTVCQTCALRKKACDKSLPTCGFCMKKNISCKYEILKPREGGRRAYHPGRNFVAITTHSSSINSCNEPEIRQAWVNPLLQPMACASSQSIDKFVHQHVSHIIQAVNLTPESVGQQYFRTFDRSLPIISPELFDQVAMRFGNTITPPPAVYSVLFLGMLLVIGLPDLKVGRQSHPFDRKSIYLTAKTLVAQLQAIISPSLQLVQAAFLIAACEHISGSPEVAYMSVVSCISMTRILGVGETRIGDPIAEVGNCRSRLMKKEMLNVAWAVAMLERIILCELRQRQLRPMTELPSLDSRASLDLQQSPVFNDWQRDNPDVSEPVTLSIGHELQITTTMQQAQAICLIDQALYVRSSTRDDKERFLLEVAELDSKIHTFLGEVLNRDWKTQDTPSTIVALAVRSLFLLHGAVIDATQLLPTEMTHKETTKSWDTLYSACNMVLDITRYRKLDQADMMPICCYYNLRSSIEHLQNRKWLDEIDRSSDIMSLLDSEKRYRRRWCFI